MLNKIRINDQLVLKKNSAANLFTNQKLFEVHDERCKWKAWSSILCFGFDYNAWFSFEKFTLKIESMFDTWKFQIWMKSLHSEFNNMYLVVNNLYYKENTCTWKILTSFCWLQNWPNNFAFIANFLNF